MKWIIVNIKWIERKDQRRKPFDVCKVWYAGHEVFSRPYDLFDDCKYSLSDAVPYGFAAAYNYSWSVRIVISHHYGNWTVIDLKYSYNDLPL